MRSARRTTPVLRFPQALPHAAVGPEMSEAADRTARSARSASMRAPLLPRWGAKSAQPPHACSPHFSPAGLPRSALQTAPSNKNERKATKAGAAHPRYVSLRPSAPRNGAASSARQIPQPPNTGQTHPHQRCVLSALTAPSGLSCCRAAP